MLSILPTRSFLRGGWGRAASRSGSGKGGLRFSVESTIRRKTESQVCICVFFSFLLAMMNWTEAGDDVVFFFCLKEENFFFWCREEESSVQCDQQIRPTSDKQCGFDWVLLTMDGWLEQKLGSLINGCFYCWMVYDLLGFSVRKFCVSWDLGVHFGLSENRKAWNKFVNQFGTAVTVRKFIIWL